MSVVSDVGMDIEELLECDSPRSKQFADKVLESPSVKQTEMDLVCNEPPLDEDTVLDMPPELVQCTVCGMRFDGADSFFAHSNKHAGAMGRVEQIMRSPVPSQFGIIADKAFVKGEAHDLFLRSDRASLKRGVLWARLSSSVNDGINHDVLYQTLTWMIDFALHSGPGVVDRRNYNRDTDSARRNCSLCEADAKWVCLQCKKTASSCVCKKKKTEFHTEKIMWSPAVTWVCARCGLGNFACDCQKPIKDYDGVTREHNAAYWKRIDILNAQASEGDEKLYTTRQERREMILGDQRQILAYFCALNHYPDTKHFVHRTMLGVYNHMDIPGRWQWTKNQFSVSIVIQAMDMLLMVLACSDKIHLNAAALPVVAMMCLALQVESDDDCLMEKPRTYIRDHAFPIAVSTKDIVNTLWAKVFQFILPGQTLPRIGRRKRDTKRVRAYPTESTGAHRWMRQLNDNTKVGVNQGLQFLQEEEDKVARFLFHFQDTIPRLHPVSGLQIKQDDITEKSGNVLVLRPEAYRVLFNSYDGRLKRLARMS